MANWFSKGQSQYTSGNFHMAYYIDMNGYPEANYDDQDIEGEGESGDPFMAFAIDTQTWTYGSQQVEFGLLSSYRFKADSTGLYGWNGSGWTDLLAAGGAENLGDLSDVVISTPADNEVLAYNNATSKWINQTPAEAGLATAGHGHGQLHDQNHDNTDHTTNYEAEFSKNTGFNKNFGTVTGTVAQGDDSRFHTLYTNAEAVAAVEAAGLTLATTKVITSADEDLDFYFGKNYLGSSISGFSNTAVFAHRDMTLVGHYALIQQNDFSTRINAYTGKTISHRINNVEKMSMSATALTLSTGVVINSADEDLTFTFGRVIIRGLSDIAEFKHRDATRYAIFQSALGMTAVCADTGQGIYFRINNVNKAVLSTTQLSMTVPISLGANNLLFSTGGITSDDADTTFTFGRIGLGSPYADFAVFGHRDRINTTEYALMQAQDGRTYLNTTGTMRFLVNHATRITFTNNAFTFGSNIDLVMNNNAITWVSNVNMTSASSIINVFAVGVGGGNERTWNIIIDDDPSFYGLYDATLGSYVFQAKGNDGDFWLNRTLDMNTHQIIGVVDPTNDQDVATKKYVVDNLHAESHTVVSHSDTTATGANLNTLVGAGDTTLHKHDGQYYTETEIDNRVFEKAATFPGSPIEGDLHYDTVDEALYRYSGDAQAWIQIGASGVGGGVYPITGIASDDLVFSNDTSRNTASTAYVKLKEIAVYRNLALRVSWAYWNGSPPGTVYTKVYINGVAVGSEKSTTSGSAVSATEDVEVNSGDLLQIYGKVSVTDSPTCYINNMRIKFIEYVITGGY